MRCAETVRATASLLLTVHSVACTAAYSQSGSTAELISARHPSEIQLHRKDGISVLLVDPAVSRDSVWGRRVGDPRAMRQGIALRDIEWAQVKGTQVDGPRTLRVVAVVAVVSLAAVLILHSMWDWKPLGG